MNFFSVAPQLEWHILPHFVCNGRIRADTIGLLSRSVCKWVLCEMSCELLGAVGKILMYKLEKDVFWDFS